MKVPTTKIKATDSKSMRVKKTTVGPKSTAKTNAKRKYLLLKGIAAFFGYFRNSWIELRKVRWPNRRATWGMVGAVLLFTTLFIVLIVSLDAIFSQLFNLIIK